jgi:hypothetical protein
MPLACQDAVKRAGKGLARPEIAKPVDMVVAIDTSGSMGQFSHKVILDSVNSFIANQKKTCPDTTISVLTFSETITTLYYKMAIANVPDITAKDVVPQSSTALYDAFAEGLEILNSSKESNNQVILVITDGLENASKDNTRSQIVEKIAKGIEKGYLIKFLGGGHDAVGIGLGLGIAEDCCLSFTNNDDGLGSAMLAASQSLERHALGKCHSFTPLERAKSQSNDACPLPRVKNCHVSFAGGLARTPTAAPP